MEILPDKWVKPFSSALSCINTITGECIRGKTVDECMKLCKDSTKCNFGYHVQVPNEKSSYCLPIDGMPHWGNPSAFLNSTISPSSSPILNPNIGVKVTAFQNPDSLYFEEPSRTTITQLGIYLIRVRLDPSRPQSDLYLMNDMTFGDDPNNALQVVIIRDLPVSSGISTAEDTIRNGELVFLKNSENNNVFLFIDEDNYGFFPFTIRWSSSIAFNVEDLYHTQLVTKYPFHHTAIDIEEMFAIRCAPAPVTDFVYYWDMDRSSKRLVMRKVSMKDMSDFSHLDVLKIFSLERQDKINIFQAENFINSQSQYLFNTFVPTQEMTNPRSYRDYFFLTLKIILCGLVLLGIILFIHKRL